MGKLGAGRMGSRMHTSVVGRRRLQLGGMGNQLSLKTLVDRQEMGVGRHTEAGGESVETESKA